MEGGFDGGVEKVEYEEQLSVVAMPERTTVSLPNEQLPQKVEDILSLSLCLSHSLSLDHIILTKFNVLYRFWTP